MKNQILQAALDGKISVIDAEGLLKLINNEIKQHDRMVIPDKLPMDPIEAARIYQQMMIAD